MTHAATNDVQLLLWGALFIATAIVTLCASIAYTKLRRERVESVAERARTALIDDLLELLESDVSFAVSGCCVTVGSHRFNIPSPAGRDAETVTETMLSLIATISGVGRSRLVQILEEGGYVDRAISLLHSPSKNTRARGCMTLGAMLSPRSIPSLTERLLDDRDANVRLTAAEALAAIGDAPVTPILLEALHEKTTWQRLRVANALAQLGAIAVPALVFALTDADDDVVTLSLEILCAIGTVDDLLPVIRLLRHASPEIRSRAVELVGIAGAVDLIVHVLNRTQDPVWFVRVRALRALERLGVPDDRTLRDLFYDRLTASLEDESWWVREHAAGTLADSGERGRNILRDSTADCAAAALQLRELQQGMTLRAH